MSVAMQKRQPRRAVNAQGDHIGGQFARADRSNELELANMASASGSPYPTKKRQVTIRLPSFQSNKISASKAPAVRVKKDPNTGFWEAETPYCNPQSGYAMERLRGGLTGDESEIVGYYAQTAAALCNAGLVDVGSKEQISWVQSGVSSAAICLGLPGSWGQMHKKTKSKLANAIVSECDDYAMTGGLLKRARMLYSMALLGSRLFCRPSSYDFSEDYGPIDDPLYYQKRYEETWKEKQGSLAEEEMLIWSVSFQHAVQHFLHNTPKDSIKDIDDIKGLVPDTLLAGAASQAIKGKICFGESEHHLKLLHHWIMSSESEHTSHVFDSDTVGVITYADPARLPERLNKDWHSWLPRIGQHERWKKIANNPDPNRLSIRDVWQEIFETVKASPDLCFKNAQIEVPHKKGDQAIHRLSPEKVQFPVTERHFDLMGDGVEIRNSAGDLHRAYSGRDAEELDRITPHPIIPKLCLALHTMATFAAGEPARKIAERFITETNAQPLAATLVARGVKDATAPPRTLAQADSFKRVLTEQKPGANNVARSDLNPKFHNKLIRNMAQAWHDFDHDSSVYALSGGRLDPEVMLKQAQHLPMSGSVA